ncbi:dentin sialophosphoprotein-like [Cryptotermes secundus]|uniref:dentin sialophosphoprotein-like n=1 Tax=Cryptotermes secundus TaxID=105785 RepID=UPI000CD7AF6F|nr:dentin sialophosphoprotein-like [Cryptotermes secundus]
MVIYRRLNDHIVGEGHSSGTINDNSRATGDNNSPATVDGDSTDSSKGDSPVNDSDSTETGEGNSVSYRNEGSHTVTCSTGDHAYYTLHEREAQCSMLNSADAVELGLKSAAENQGGAENSVSEGDENAQTLSLQAPELKEMDPSATEAWPLNTSAKQERREQLHEKFEPLRRQDAPCEKNKMRKTMKETNRGQRRLEELTKRLRAVPQNTTRDPDSTATCDGDSTATGECDRVAAGKGDSRATDKCDRLAASKGDSTATCDGGSTATGECDRLAAGKGNSTATCDRDSTATCDRGSTATCNGDSTATGEGESTASGEGDSPAIGNDKSPATCNADLPDFYILKQRIVKEFTVPEPFPLPRDAWLER